MYPSNNDMRCGNYTNSNSFNYYEDRFIPYDDTTGSDPWYK